jgi:uncharacterized protein YndB with AHSA1/START domain
MLGGLTTTNEGRFALRFERRLAHPPEAVWRAITDVAQLRSWFVEILDYDRSQLQFAAGARLTYVPKGDLDLPADHGEVIRFKPPRLLEYTWGTEVLRWELSPDGDTGCRLVFTNIGDNPGTAAAVAPGWHIGLDKLAALLDGDAGYEPPWDQIQQAYVRSLT